MPPVKFKNEHVWRGGHFVGCCVSKHVGPGPFCRAYVVLRHTAGKEAQGDGMHCSSRGELRRVQNPHEQGSAVELARASGRRSHRSPSAHRCVLRPDVPVSFFASSRHGVFLELGLGLLGLGQRGHHGFRCAACSGLACSSRRPCLALGRGIMWPSAGKRAGGPRARSELRWSRRLLKAPARRLPSRFFE